MQEVYNQEELKNHSIDLIDNYYKNYVHRISSHSYLLEQEDSVEQDSNSVFIKDILHDLEQGILFEYDFGASHMFKIETEKMTPKKYLKDI